MQRRSERKGPIDAGRSKGCAWRSCRRRGLQGYNDRGDFAGVAGCGCQRPRRDESCAASRRTARSVILSLEMEDHALLPKVDPLWDFTLRLGSLIVGPGYLLNLSLADRFVQADYD